jgi:hypothetical protein
MYACKSSIFSSGSSGAIHLNAGRIVIEAAKLRKVRLFMLEVRPSEDDREAVPWGRKSGVFRVFARIDGFAVDVDAVEAVEQQSLVLQAAVRFLLELDGAEDLGLVSKDELVTFDGGEDECHVTSMSEENGRAGADTQRPVWEEGTNHAPARPSCQSSAPCNQGAPPEGRKIEKVPPLSDRFADGKRAGGRGTIRFRQHERKVLRFPRLSRGILTFSSAFCTVLLMRELILGLVLAMDYNALKVTHGKLSPGKRRRSVRRLMKAKLGEIKEFDHDLRRDDEEDCSRVEAG